METDNAMEKAYKTKICNSCNNKTWFWRKICEDCFKRAIRNFLNIL